MVRLLLRAVLLCASVCLPPLAAAPRLVVATQTNNPPYEYLDAEGRPTGYGNDVMRAAAAQAGFELDLRPMAWTDLRAAFEQGEVQAVAGMVFSEERARSMDFTVPHSYVPYVLIIRKGEDRIRSEHDLPGRKILVMGKSIMSDHLDILGLPYEEMSSHEESLLQLALGRGDAVMAPKYAFLHLARTRDLRNLEAVPSEIYPTKRCIAVRKGDAALLAKLNEALFLIKQNGRMDEIYGRHLGALEASEVPFSEVLKRSLKVLVPAFLAVALAAALLWSFTLKRLVDRKTARLQTALAEVHRLSGLIPICAHCKKVRDDEGYWQAVEGYISEHSEARFSHGLCPDCVKVHFPEYEEAAHPQEDLENWSGT